MEIFQVSDPQSMAPGPRGIPVLGSALDIQRDVLGLMMRSREAYGDIARHKAGPITIYSVQGPDAIEQILKDRINFDKRTRSSKMIRRLTGDSILVTDGSQWENRRKIMQPGFAPPKIKRFVGAMMDAARPTLEALDRCSANRQPIDISAEMMKVTYRIVEKALFDSESDEAIAGLEQAISVVLKDIYRRIERPFNAPLFVPTPANREYKQAMQFLNHHVDEIIRQHRRERKNTLLSMLMEAFDSSGIESVDEQLRNETITMLIAGHETTACALMWFWYLMAMHPEIESKLVQELPNREFAQNDFAELESIRLAFNETLRLYPPIWAIIRRVRNDQVIGGFRIRRGSRIILSPYVVHRHPDYWSDPETFDPFRSRPSHHYAYIPFGGGPRLCIGHSFARLEAQVVIGMIMQRYRLRLVEGHPVELDPGITLRSRHGMPMLVERRP